MQSSSPATAESLSLVTPIGYQRKTRCGYCEGSNSSANYYATSSSLTVEHYQKLIDRGWRRSGTVLYKPDLRHSCCPHYTIRLDATLFKPSKDQRQTLNRWKHHVLGDDYIHQAARLYPKSRKENKKRKNEFDLLEEVHACESQKLEKSFHPAITFDVKLEQDNFTEEKYKVFADYQQKVHKEPSWKITRDGFRRFLCDSPLIRKSAVDADGKDQLLGSYHQCYRIDGRLVAIGVIDILPSAISGVYFAYDEDVSKWHFGKLGALQETALAKETGSRFYYMGYYIHSCIKMRYKGDYKPQYVLDPETYVWGSLDSYQREFEQKKYVSISSLNGDTEHLPKLESSKLHSEDQDLPQQAEHETSYEDDDEEATSSLFDRQMPGILSLDDIISNEDIDLGKMRVQVRKISARLEDLQGWNMGEYEEEDSLKHAIAELAACVGLDLCRPEGLVVRF